MSIIRFFSCDKTYAQMRLETKHRQTSQEVDRINSILDSCQKEYDKLSNIFKANEVVGKVSTAVGFISALSLMPSDEARIVAENAPELLSTSSGKVVLGCMLGGFAVAGISSLVSKHLLGKINENEETQSELYDDLEREEDSLLANENMQAINYLKGEIYGDDMFIPLEGRCSYESDVPVISEHMKNTPRITIIDQRYQTPADLTTTLPIEVPTDDLCQ